MRDRMNPDRASAVQHPRQGPFGRTTWHSLLWGLQYFDPDRG
jgi:hypothetical protein